jgi:hypothetical protein
LWGNFQDECLQHLWKAFSTVLGTRCTHFMPAITKNPPYLFKDDMSFSKIFQAFRSDGQKSVCL